MRAIHPVSAPPPGRQPSAEEGALIACGVAGAALIASRRRMPPIARGAATVAGLALVGVAAIRPLGSLLRSAGARRRAASVRMSFTVRQPVERVFGFCRDFENYPRFVGALRSVSDFGDGRSHWCASTPAGDTIEWNAVTTKYLPNRAIAWETTPTSPVRSTGSLRFRPEEGSTCVEVMLTYELATDSPIKDALAALAAPSRRALLEADVRRLAHYLDTAPDSELAAYGV